MSSESAVYQAQSGLQLPFPPLPPNAPSKVSTAQPAHPLNVAQPSGVSPTQALIPASTAHGPDSQSHIARNAECYSPLTQLLAFFGMGRTASKARKSLAPLIWHLVWGLTQVTVIILVLVLTRVQNPEVSEWKRCSRPLGILAALWTARVLLASGLAYLEFRACRFLRPPSDSERTNETNNTDGPPPNDPASQGNFAVKASTLSDSVLYSRLALWSVLITASWFLTAHVLAYTSMHTCRFTSPYLWWLVFGIMCTVYLMILEAVVLGFVVCIITPILFCLWTIILLCLGKHPMQNPTSATDIIPQVRKLSEAEVDKIPSGFYVPAPLSCHTTDSNKGLQTPNIISTKPVNGWSIQTLLTHTGYIFSFGWTKERGQKKAHYVELEDTTSPSSFDRGTNTKLHLFPLDRFHATCGICLADFEEPAMKKWNKIEMKTEEEVKEVLKTKNGIDVGAGGSALTPNSRNSHKAGQGACLIRLLECGHAAHKSCVDPWLTTVSGRCPTCSTRAIAEPKDTSWWRLQ